MQKQHFFKALVCSINSLKAKSTFGDIIKSSLLTIVLHSNSIYIYGASSPIKKLLESNVPRSIPTETAIISQLFLLSIRYF